jgi:hypothetical protein
MTEDGSESLSSESPEQENARLRAENARLRRLLAVHGIPIPQVALENPPPPKVIETPSPVDKEERADGQSGYGPAGAVAPRRGRVSNSCGMPAAIGSGGFPTDSSTCGCLSTSGEMAGGQSRPRPRSAMADASVILDSGAAK